MVVCTATARRITPDVTEYNLYMSIHGTKRCSEYNQKEVLLQPPVRRTRYQARAVRWEAEPPATATPQAGLRSGTTVPSARENGVRQQKEAQRV
jgi:hypothetical protein